MKEVNKSAIKSRAWFRPLRGALLITQLCWWSLISISTTAAMPKSIRCEVPIDLLLGFKDIPEIIVFSQKSVDENKADGYVFGHAGDGNLHVVIAGDPSNQKEWATLEKTDHLIVEQVTELGSTCLVNMVSASANANSWCWNMMKSIKDMANTNQVRKKC